MLHRLGSAICSSTVDTAITWRRWTWGGLQFNNGRHWGRCHYVGQGVNSIMLVLLLLLRSDTGGDLGHLETRGRTAPRTAYRLLFDVHQATIWPFRNGTAISACIKRKFQRKSEAVGFITLGVQWGQCGRFAISSKSFLSIFYFLTWRTAGRAHLRNIRNFYSA